MAIRSAASRGTRSASTQAGAVAVISNVAVGQDNSYDLSSTSITPTTVWTELIANTSAAVSITSVVPSTNPVIANIVYYSDNTFTGTATVGNIVLGANVGIFGSNFLSNSQVYVAGTKTANTFVSSSRINLTLPPTAIGTYSLMIFNSNTNAAMYPAGIQFATVPVWVTTGTLPMAGVGTAYSTTLLATSTGTVSYAVTSGTLPTGLSLSSSGVITGTPPGLTTQIFTVVATNQFGQSSSQVLTLQVGYTVNYVIIGGGGSGGSLGSPGTAYCGGGGGGAGGVVVGQKNVAAIQSFNLVVGGAGSNSSGFSTVAVYGGPGGSGSGYGLIQTGNPGGSGGGADYDNSRPGVSGSGAGGIGFQPTQNAGVPGIVVQYGNPGGTGTPNAVAGGGGGGALSAGVPLTNGPTAAGAGIVLPFSSNFYANGGYPTAGSTPTPPVGSLNTGSGGNGGNGGSNTAGTAGSSGVVVLWYSGPQQSYSGDVITTFGGNTVHYFNNSGTFVTSTSPTWVTKPLLAAVVNTFFYSQLSATDLSPLTYTVSSNSSLPTGTTLSTVGNLTGTVTTRGTYSFYANATNSIGNTAVQQFTLSVGDYIAQVLVVGGGGGGAGAPIGGPLGGGPAVGGGGGGGGGLLTGNIALISGQAYTNNIGPGGAGSNGNDVPGTPGWSSNIIASGTTLLTVAGGGGGGDGFGPNSPTGSPGLAGGSGGGGGAGGGPTPNNVPGIPTSGGNPGGAAVGYPSLGQQGYPGGRGAFASAPTAGSYGGGGGGAGGVGAPGQNYPGTGPLGGAGGAGYTWPVTGSVYAGGGGGGASPAGAPGSPGAKGAGGNGSFGENGAATGAAGTVIIAVPTPAYPGSAPGASVSTPPAALGYTVITYTAPGIFTA